MIIFVSDHGIVSDDMHCVICLKIESSSIYIESDIEDQQLRWGSK